MSTNEPETPVDNGVSPTPDSNMQQSTSKSALLSCEMCQNYETNLTIMQEEERRLKTEIKSLKGITTRYEEVIAKDRSYKQDLEKRMAELAAETEDIVDKAIKENLRLDTSLKKFTEQQTKELLAHKAEIDTLSGAFATYETNYAELSKKYKDLLGFNRSSADEMRSEVIDLPQEVDKLQFICLTLREELIELKAARNHERNVSKDEITVLREQFSESFRVKEGVERDLLNQVNDLNTKLGIASSKLVSVGDAVAISDEQSRKIRDLQEAVAELEAQVTQVQNERQAVEMTAQNYKARCSALQQELDTMECVQKDFVKLSQSLQIQLEKIRQSEQEVRWQWEEDVENCSGCEVSIARLRPKPRCHHCVKLFCEQCVKTKVPSGPNRRPAPVCQVCHTLLDREGRPFFAQDPK
ncbi:unnamed protein product [Auanema sp. JU1783]|nr:unnamed protein product [Auanema sp. JU1783]